MNPNVFERFYRGSVKETMERWLKMQKKALPILWLATLVLFPFEPAGREIAGICLTCPVEEAAPSHPNCAQIQDMSGSLRRMTSEIVPVAAQKPNFCKPNFKRCARPAAMRVDDEAVLLSQSWQFTLRAAVQPRAPSFNITSC
jgi:hypothetical protein